MDKGQKIKSEKSLLFKFVLVFLMLLVLLLVVGTIKEYLHQQELDSEMAALQAEIEKLNLDKKQFLSSIDAYQDEFFIEQEARLKFNLQKPEEKVLVIPAERIAELGGTGQLALADNNKEVKGNIYINNFRSWWDYFFQVRAEGN